MFRFSALLIFWLLSNSVAYSQSKFNSENHGLFIWFKHSVTISEDLKNNYFKTYGEELYGNLERAFITNEDPINRIWSLEGLTKEQSDNLIGRLSKLEMVDLVEPIPLYRLFHTPNDLVARQWNLRKVQAEKAWDISKGDKKVVIALVDDGLDTLHEDIQPLLWHNTKEIPGNKLDDDGNGWTDDYFGWDVADNDNDPSVVVSDGLNHGTHCAGIIGARTNNGKGIAGLGYQCQIMAIKTGQKGVPYLTRPYKGVEYAIANKASVISMSWGGGSYSSTYEALFALAFKRGIVCVAAAGNSNDSFLHYPAAYKNVIAVGSTDSFDRKSSFSCFGTWVDVMAPGSSIYSCLPGNQYGYMSGTSMACPLVSGLAGLMFSLNPLQTPDEVESCIKSTCKNIDNQNTAYKGQLGAGRIDAFAALSCVKSVRALFSSDRTRVCNNDSIQFSDLSTGKPVSWKWTFSGGNPSVSTKQNPVVKYSTTGLYNVKLVVDNGQFKDSIEEIKYIDVGRPTMSLKGLQTIVRGDFGTLEVKLTGKGPWNFKFTNRKDTFEVKNALNSPYYHLFKPDTNSWYYPVSVHEGSCSGSVSDSFRITVVNQGSMICDSAARYYMRWGGTNEDEVYRIVEYDDTTLILAGRTKTYGSGNFSAFLAKVSINGYRFWYKTYGGTQEDGFYSVVLDGNKDIHAGGYTFSGTSQKAMFFIKTDKNGNLLWKKHYDGSSLEVFRNAILSRDKKYVYYSGPSISNSYGSEDYTMAKVDTSGNVSWVKQIGDSDFNRNDGVWEDSTGNMYVVGTQGASFPYVDAGLFKLSPSGSVLWGNRYRFTSGGYNEIFEKIVCWKERALFTWGFCGLYNGSYSSNEMWMSRLDMSGNVIWAKKYTLGTMNSSGLTISGNNLYVTGYTSNNGGDAYVMKLDTNGNVLRALTIGNSASQTGNEITTSTDGGIYVMGIDRATANGDLFIAKSNCKLDFLCNVQTANPSVTSMAVTVSSLSYSTKDFSTGKTVALSVASHTPATGFLCKNNVKPVKTQCNLVAAMQIVPACTGEPVSFLDRSKDFAGYTIVNHFWDFGDGSNVTGQKNTKHIYSKNGKYTVRLIVQSVKDQYSCVDTIESEYISNDSFRIKQMIPESTICVNDSIQLGKPTTYCGEEPLFYAWTPSSGINDTTLAMPYFYPKKQTKYFVIITDYQGRKVLDSFIVNVNLQCCVSTARFAVKDDKACVNSPVYFVNESTHKRNAVFKWFFQGTSISTYTGFEPPGLIYSSPGQYPVRMILTDSCSTDTMDMKVYVAPLPRAFAGNDTTVCMPNTLRLGEGAMDWHYYQWTPNIGMVNNTVADPVVSLTKSITYHLKVVSDLRCEAFDSIVIAKLDNLFNLGNDTSICDNNSIQLSSGLTKGKHLWSTGDTTFGIVVNKSGTYWLSVEENPCKFRDTINIQLDSIPAFDLGSDIEICESSFPLNIQPVWSQVSGAKYLWSIASTGSILQVNKSGKYWLRMTNGNCAFADTIVVNADTSPGFYLASDTSVCETELPITFGILSKPGWKILWGSGETTPVIYTSLAGMHRITVTNGNCVVSDSVLLGIDKSPVFTLGPDTLICKPDLPFILNPRGLNVSGVTYFWDNGLTTKQRSISDTGTYTLKISNNLCFYEDQIRIDTMSAPTVRLIEDTSICSGDTLFLDAGLRPFTTYLWNTGNKNHIQSAIKTGVYQVELKNNCGTSSDEVKVVERDCSCPIYIPNAFTPSHSKQINDVLSVVLDCPVEVFNIQIYNRWGGKVFESNNPSFGWDGTYLGNLLPAGPYCCVIKVRSKFENGGREFFRSGIVNILE